MSAPAADPSRRTLWVLFRMRVLVCTGCSGGQVAAKGLKRVGHANRRHPGLDPGSMPLRQFLAAFWVLLRVSGFADKQAPLRVGGCSVLAHSSHVSASNIW